MRTEDVVYNRACEVGDEAGLGVGDLHLRRLLLAHGDVLNGGMGAAHDRLTLDEKRAAASASRYFGSAQLGAIFDELTDPNLTDAELKAFEDRYYYEVAGWEQASAPHSGSDSSKLIAMFEARFQETPSDFAPVKS